MTTKTELYVKLEEAGFNCQRDSKYTKQMLVTILDSIKNSIEPRIRRENKFKYLEEKIILVDEIKALREINKKISTEYADVIDNLVNDNEKLENENKNLNLLSNEQDNTIQFLVKDTHSKHICEDVKIENEDLKFRLKEITREFKNHRKKDRKHVKKQNGKDLAPPPYEPV